MEGALYVVLCALLINSCICTATTGRDRPKPHEETLLEKDHTVNGEHNTEYDHEAFLGDMEDEYDGLTPEEAQKRLRVFVKRVDADKDGFVSEEELTKWVKDVFSKRLTDGVEEDAKVDRSLNLFEQAKSPANKKPAPPKKPAEHPPYLST